MGTSINYATFKEELLTNSMDPTVQRKIRPEHKLQTRSIKSLSTKFINEIQLSCELSLLNALKSGKNTLWWRMLNLWWGKPGVWLLGKGYFQQMLQMSKIKRQAASHFQPNLRAFQVLGSRGRFPKVLTGSLSTNKDAIPQQNFTPLCVILLALIFMKCFSMLLRTISSKRANSPLPLQSNGVAVANGGDEGGGGKI